MLFENDGFSSSRLHPEVIGDILKKNNNKSLCLNVVIYLVTKKMILKLKNRYHIDTTQIDLGEDKDTNILNIKCVSI